MGVDFRKQLIQELGIDHDDVFLVRVVQIFQLSGNKKAVRPPGPAVRVRVVIRGDGHLSFLFYGFRVPAAALQRLDCGEILVVVDRVEIQNLLFGDKEKISEIISGISGQRQGVSDLFAQGIPVGDGHAGKVCLGAEVGVVIQRFCDVVDVFATMSSGKFKV